MASSKKRPPAECPVCGADVPPHAHACPGCGADERTGWDEEATRYDGVELPDEAFDDEPRKPSRLRPRAGGVSPLWQAIGLVLLAMLLWLTFRGF